MYRVNELKRKTLITVDEVIFHVNTNHTVDPRAFQQAIIIAEERFIRPAIGFEFYEELRDQKNRAITNVTLSATQTQVNDSLPEDVDPVTLVVGDIVNAREYLSADNLILWDEYLWKLTAECVRFVAIPQNYAFITSQGLLHNKPVAGSMGNESVAPELRSAKWMMDKALSDSIDPLIEAMHQWVCKIKSSTPSKYTKYTKVCDCDSNGISYKRKTDIILDIYDDDDEPSNCGCQ